MNEDTRPIDDADLNAWVDGRLDPARRLLVQRHLDANPALRQRVTDWATQAAGLRRALRDEDEAARHALLQRLAARRPPARPGLRWALAASLLLAASMGGAGGWIARGDRRPSEISRLGVEAATAYRIFGTDPGQPVEVSAGDRDTMRAMLGQKLGRPVQVPDLSAMGYRLVNGRVVAAIYGPAAMLVYADAGGNHLTVYLQPMQVGAPAAMRPIQTEALNGYAWIEQKIGYTVMSDDAKERLHAAANRVRDDTRL
jgi:anti-sigma factor RsiW